MTFKTRRLWPRKFGIDEAISLYSLPKKELLRQPRNFSANQGTSPPTLENGLGGIRTHIVIPSGRARRVQEGPYDALALQSAWTGLARVQEVRDCPGYCTGNASQRSSDTLLGVSSSDAALSSRTLPPATR